jgi:hypothetical protein
MTVRRGADGVVQLIGRCGSDDAAPLLDYLTADPAAKVDWRACETAHTAVIQVLWLAKRELLGPPSDDFLARWVGPCLA